MLKLKKLTLDGIGRFVETQTVDFTSLGHLVQLGGKNNNTGGSSGAGKSTVFNALDFLLGVNDIPNSSLQSRLTKEVMTVSGEFDWDGKSVTVTRNKKLTIEIDGSVVSGSNKLAEEELDKVLGMPRELFRKLLHKRQKEGGFFLQLTPKENHEFLSDTLGLGSLQKKIEIVDKKIKDLSDTVSKAKTTHFGATQGYESNQNALAAIGAPPKSEVTQDTILALKSALDEALATVEPIKLAHKAELVTLEQNRPQGTVLPYDYSEQNQLNDQLRSVESRLADVIKNDNLKKNAVNQKINDLRVQKVQAETVARRGDQAMAEALGLAAEIKKIQAAMCPTCDQTWVTDAAKAKEKQTIDRCIALGTEVSAGVQAKTTSAQISEQIVTLQGQEISDPEIPNIVNEAAAFKNLIMADKAKEQAWTASQNVTNQAAMNEYVINQRNVLTRQRAELDLVQGQAGLAQRNFEAVVQKMQAYDRDSKQYEKVLANLKSGETLYQKQMSDASLVLAESIEELALAEESKKIIKSFASCAFDDALEEVGEMATRFVRAIPTMANATITLEGTRETKEGKIKEEVNAVISMDGEIDIPIKTLSGGERSSVDLAIDLAVIDLLETKSNKGIDIFVLDEPFTGLDTIGIEMALEVLKSCNQSKRLVIVDHNPEIKEMVQSNLTVVRDGQTSKIVQA